ncbi:hypothetical protein [Synoicihabitans lomoniglobus]|uniref:CobW/HypB/UreG nucleotide-binding domain-containing protein n=1 Tax=Synoicihabitans lomoniglobus TaxID=2909285 RepID=A0AAE9ZYH0_9BACT|nr:hypothetical protein [Opitutaceae bacterium LMO-M01]WED65694.1 hypothetical protein PXH66_02390 [Opitutaceae bacterium LMO-M01]
MSEIKPLVYVILGAAGSGRREVVADLIEGGVDASENVAVLLAANEVDDPADAQLQNCSRWHQTEDNAIAADWPAGATVVFFVMDGRASPVDQVEMLKPWVTSHGAEVGRVITVMHCGLAASNSRVVAWYDACVHFSDIVLLNRREGVENKWFSELKARYHKLCLPCLVEMVKKGRVHNPALVLDSTVRRLSHWFDEDEQNDWTALIAEDSDTVIEDDADDDPDDMPDDEDIYLARHPSGRRMKEVPDIAKLLD